MRIWMRTLASIFFVMAGLGPVIHVLLPHGCKAFTGLIGTKSQKEDAVVSLAGVPAGTARAARR
jgi:hypothetical protein